MEPQISIKDRMAALNHLNFNPMGVQNPVPKKKKGPKRDEEGNYLDEYGNVMDENEVEEMLYNLKNEEEEKNDLLIVGVPPPPQNSEKTIAQETTENPL